MNGQTSRIFRRHIAIPAVFFLALGAFAETSPAQNQPPDQITKLRFDIPKVALRHVQFEVKVEALNHADLLIRSTSDTVKLKGFMIATDSGVEPLPSYVVLHGGKASIPNAVFTETGKHEIEAMAGSVRAASSIRAIPGILSLMPPLLAIALAFITRQTLISLFSGIWLGAVFLNGYNPVFGFMKTLDTYIIKSLADESHAAILIFSLTLGGMVGIISKAGGTQGIVDKLRRYANNPRGGQLATWAMGLMIFFDDYANTLIVGNTMRPFTDRLRISREKLSYIVDSTAAPVASIALVSTWVGFQVGLIDQALGNIEVSRNAYSVFLQSIPHSTYSLLAIVFVFLIGFSLRDFGPMKAAETRAHRHGKVLRDGAQPIAESSDLDLAPDGAPLRWYNAIIPIMTVIVITLIGLYHSGSEALGGAAADASLGKIIGEANSFSALMWASFSGLLVAGVAAVGQRILTLGQTINAAIAGYKSMILAAMVLIMAWAIGDVCADLKTADFVIDATKGILSPHWVPVLTFAVAAFISFSTGSSWATMAILTPIVVPIAYHLPLEAGLAAALSDKILIGTVGAILSGSVLGDHCSPISDTTILSSMASAADHVDHVRTQLPYALVVGGIACLVGYLPVGWGMNPYISLVVGAGILIGIVYGAGKTITERGGESGG